MRILTRWLPRAVALAAVAAAGAAAPASANIAVQQVSHDPFSNNTSQHQTEVEPDTFVSPGGTLISTFQVGRFFNGGSSDIGFVRRDAGGTWGTPGFLPGLTKHATPANPDFERVSDPSVAYDAADGVWLISSIPLKTNLSVPVVFVSRSTDDGLT